MFRKLLGLVLMVAGVLGVATATPSDAQVDYAGCIVTINPTQLNPGATIQVTGSGLQPNFQTQIVFDRGQPSQAVLGTVTTSAAGAFATSVVVPANASPGAHTISAACGAASGITSTAVQVLGITNVNPDLTLSKSVVRRLETFVATVTNAQPGSRVDFAQFSVRVPVGSAVADANGTARLTMSFPTTATLGPHEVEATGVDIDGDAFRLRDPITVIADSVAKTGTDIGPPAIAGGVAVAIGAVLVIASRRRRAAHAAS